MKRFLLRLLVLSGPLLLFVFILNALYIRTDSWHLENGMGKFNSIPETINLAAFGNSHTKNAFIFPKSYHRNSFNFGLGGGLFNRDDTLLRHYQTRLSTNAVCIFNISYFSFVCESKQSKLADRVHFYRLLPYSQIPGARYNEYIRYFLFPVLSAGPNLWKIFNDELWHPPTNLSHRALGRMAQTRYANIMGLTESVFNMGCVKESSETLIRMIHHCYSSGYTPVLITIPVSRELDRLISEDVKREFHTRIETLRMAGGSPAYLDYSQDSRFMDDATLFADSDHFNQIGAQQFTEVVLSDLQQQNVLPTSVRQSSQE